MRRFAHAMDNIWILVSIWGLVAVSVIGLIAFPSSEITAYAFFVSIVLFFVYIVVTGIFVLPVLAKEKQEIRKAILDKNEEIISMYATNITAIYKTLITDLEEKGYSIKEIAIILQEIIDRPGRKTEKTNAK